MRFVCIDTIPCSSCTRTIIVKMHRALPSLSRSFPRSFPRPRRNCTSKASSKPPPPPPPPPPTQSPITWRVLALSAAACTAGLYYYSVEKQRRLEKILSPKAVGKASIGGPFSLLDGANKPFTEQHLLGRWSLMYFGFTMCPDICPAELTKVAEALTDLEKGGVTVGRTAVLAPVFITVDPERDTPARSDEYAKGFHAGFTGLGGTMEAIRAAAKTYRVYFSRDDGEGDEYLVDHSIITYLMDPRGDFVEFFGKNCTSVEMAARVRAKMLAYKE